MGASKKVRVSRRNQRRKRLYHKRLRVSHKKRARNTRHIKDKRKWYFDYSAYENHQYSKKRKPRGCYWKNYMHEISLDTPLIELEDVFNKDRPDSEYWVSDYCECGACFYEDFDI